MKQDADDDDASDEPKAVQKASNIPVLGKRKPIVGSSGIGGLNSSFKRKKWLIFLEEFINYKMGNKHSSW